MKLPEHWSKGTVKSFWQCFWFDVFMIIFGFLLVAGAIGMGTCMSADYIGAAVSFAISGIFLIVFGVSLLLFLFDF